MSEFPVTRREFIAATIAGSALTAGSVPIDARAQATLGQSGQAIGTIRVKATGRAAQSNRPFTVGVGAGKGRVPAGQTVVVNDGRTELISQLDWLNSWDDGSLRFGILSAILPTIAANQTKSLTIAPKNGPRDNSPGIAAADLLNHLRSKGGTPSFEWRDRSGKSYRADAADGLAAGPSWSFARPHLSGRWLSGPVCTEWVCSVPFQTERGEVHPSLRAWFHCRGWKVNGTVAAVRVEAILDNTLGPRNPEVVDAVGDVVLHRGTTPVWQRVGATPQVALTPDSAAGTEIKGAANSVVMTAERDVFGRDDLFKIIDVDGVMIHIVGHNNARQVVGRIYWQRNLLVLDTGRPTAGELPLTGWMIVDGAIYLGFTRRIHIEGAAKQDLTQRRFTIEGEDAGGNAVTETLAGPGPEAGRFSMSTKQFARVRRIHVDGSTNGSVNIGVAHLPSRDAIRAGSWRVWGMDVAVYTRWPVRLWYDEPAIEARPDPANFVTARLLPNYDPTMVNQRLVEFSDGLAVNVVRESDNDGVIFPNSRNPNAPDYAALNVVLAGAQAGGRPDLAVVPGQQAQWVFAPDSDKAYGAMLASGVVINGWAYHWKDRATGHCVDPAAFPRFTTHPNDSAGNRPANHPTWTTSICNMRTDPEHWVEFNYLPFLATGDLAHYEALYQSAFAGWAWHPAEWPYQSGKYGYDRGIGLGPARAMAWIMRSLGHVRAVGPDRLYDDGVTAPRGIMDRIWTTAQGFYKHRVVDGADSGTYRYIERWYAREGGAAYQVGPWQHNYLSAVAGHLTELGVYDANGREFFDWFQRYTIDLVDPAQTCPAAGAAMYYMRARKPDFSPIMSMAEAYNYMAEHEWPKVSYYEYQPGIEPIARLVLPKAGIEAGATFVMQAVPTDVYGREGVFDSRLVGRGVHLKVGDVKLVIKALIDPVDGRTNKVQVTTDRAIANAAHEPAQWSLQPPAAGPSRWSRIGHTAQTTERVYYVVGALGLLASAGTPGAAEAWKRLREMLVASGDDFPQRNEAGWWCCWAIAPRA
ncbi:MAG: hypothetical protein HY246_25750 [Proteobacteria bacterium]|nr:hypothetical protein [Pseudomonadota bacterium]